MKQERLDELLWERIDQAIGPEDREELEEYLASHAEARARERQLKDFAATLAVVGDVEPPAALRRRIGTALAARRQSVQPKDSKWSWASWGEAFRDLWSPRPLLRFASLAAALLIGAISYHLITGGTGSSSLDPAKFYGTTGLTRPDSATDAWTLELPGERGWLALHRKGPLLISEIALSYEGEGELTLLFTAGEFRLEAVEHLGSPPSRVQASAETLALDLVGPSRYTLTTKIGDPEQRIAILFSSSGEKPFERELRLDDVPEM